jgi:predicted AlkP superfamily phosphohydrolase/phosphomutase
LSERLLIIGLDAADRDLIAAWAAEGHLPAFARLQRTALWGDVRNPPGLEAGSTWPAFYFGLSPAETGQYDGARQFDPLNYKTSFLRVNRGEPIWAALGRVGKLCAVIDAPYSYPLDDINGIKVRDRAAHVPAGSGPRMDFATHPPGLAREIVERFGPDPAGGLGSDRFRLRGSADFVRFRDLYLARVENKTELTLHYWRRRPWDFFMTVFSEAHCIGHRCWHVHDPTHPQHDPALAAAVGDPLKDIYKGLDRAVGRLIEGVRDDTRVLVYLSHGMGPRYTGTRLLDRMLVRLDDPGIKRRSDPLKKAGRGAWRRLPPPVRRLLLPLVRDFSAGGFQPGRRFFEVFANDRTGGIRINLTGREAHGIVRPENYDELCARLAADLREVQNAETGEPLIADIMMTHEHYRGAYLDCLPDMLVTWNRSAPINVARSPKIGTVDTRGLLQSRTGDHRPGGRFFAAGEGWPARQLDGTVNAEDFAPTIARLFGAPPGRCDGRAIDALAP